MDNVDNDIIKYYLGVNRRFDDIGEMQKGNKMFDFIYFILIIWRTCVILYVILIKLIWCEDDGYGQVSNSYKKDYYKKLEKCCKRESSVWKSQKKL